MATVRRAVLSVVIVGLCVAGAWEWTSRREREYGQFVDRGEAALARDDTFAAVEAFSGAIALRPDAMLGYLKRGEAYSRRHALDASARDAAAIGELDPAADAAMRDLRRAAELDPLATRPLELIGDISFGLRRYDRAAERYQAYVALDDRSPRVLYKLGLAQYSAGRIAAAIGALQQAVAIDDRFGAGFYLLGLCFRDAQKPRPALQALETAVRIMPSMLNAREELADLYMRLGRRDDAVAQLETLVELDPGAARDVALGLACARAGQFDRAVATLARAAERYPDQAAPYAALGRIWLEKAQPPDRVELSKAIRALQAAVHAEDTGEALTLLGQALLLSQDVARAERILERAVAKLPVEPAAFYYLAAAAEQSGNHELARRALVDYRALGGSGEPRRAR